MQRGNVSIAGLQPYSMPKVYCHWPYRPIYWPYIPIVSQRVSKPFCCLSGLLALRLLTPQTLSHSITDLSFPIPVAAGTFPGRQIIWASSECCQRKLGVIWILDKLLGKVWPVILKFYSFSPAWFRALWTATHLPWSMHWAHHEDLFTRFANPWVFLRTALSNRLWINVGFIPLCQKAASSKLSAQILSKNYIEIFDGLKVSSYTSSATWILKTLNWFSWLAVSFSYNCLKQQVLLYKLKPQCCCILLHT